MHEYDTALKLLLQRSALQTLREIAGSAITEWINVELPVVRNLRVDLLGNDEAGELVQVELQSTNDPRMPVRMLEYYAQVGRVCDRFPRQILLYVGEDPLRMRDRLETPALTFRYHAVDVRDLDGDRLLQSEALSDNMIAVLARWSDSAVAVRRVVARIAELPPPERSEALGQLLVLAGLRHLGTVVENEVRKMPLLNDIMDHEVLGREYKKGAHAEAVIMVTKILNKRFGDLPTWVQERLSSYSVPQLEEITEHVLDATSLEQILP